MSTPTQEAIPQWLLNWRDEWQHKMTCQGVDPRVREGFGKEVPWLYDKICEDFQAKQAQGETVCRWVNGDKRKPEMDHYDEPSEYMIRIKGDDPRSGWVGVFYATIDKMENITADYWEWLEELPAQAQYTSAVIGTKGYCTIHHQLYVGVCPICSTAGIVAFNTSDSRNDEDMWHPQDYSGKNAPVEDIPVPEEIKQFIGGYLGKVVFTGNGMQEGCKAMIAMYRKLNEGILDNMPYWVAQVKNQREKVADLVAKLSAKEQECEDYRKALTDVQTMAQGKSFRVYIREIWKIVEAVFDKYPSPPTK